MPFPCWSNTELLIIIINIAWLGKIVKKEKKEKKTIIINHTFIEIWNNIISIDLLMELKYKVKCTPLNLLLVLTFKIKSALASLRGFHSNNSNIWWLWDVATIMKQLEK